MNWEEIRKEYEKELGRKYTDDEWNELKPLIVKELNRSSNTKPDFLTLCVNSKPNQARP